MKKFLSILLIIMFMGAEVQAASLAGAVSKYKRGNYSGCINDLDDILVSMSKKHDDKELAQKVISAMAKYDPEKIINGDEVENNKLNEDLTKISNYNKNDSDKWAYIFYYYALSLHQIGMGGRAKNYYNVARLFSPQTKIGEYSQQATGCIDNPGSCASSDMDQFIRSGKQVSDDIIREQLKNNLEKQKEEINKGKGLSYGDTENEKLAWVDAGVPDINEIAKYETPSETKDMPTDEEIGRAVRTLQKAGINPMAYTNPAVNNEYAQLNSLLNSGNSYSNDYATMMMMNNGTGKISPELMQTIMRQQMMGGYGF